MERGTRRALLRVLVGTALRSNLRRLTTWIFAAVFVGIALLLYRGGLSFGGMTATGAKLATNADYAIAAILGAFSFMLMHFTATLTGDPVLQDQRLGTLPLLRTTRLDVRTYLLGRFAGGYATVLCIYALFVLALFLGQYLPPAEDKLTLPPRLLPYLVHALLFVLVPTFFVGAVSFAIGTLAGSMKAVYMVVTAFLVGWFLTISNLDDEHLRWLVYLEPSGQAWLAERVARSRGNAWLNQNVIRPDVGLLLNRAALLAIGAGALFLTLARFKERDLDPPPAAEGVPGRGARLARWIRGGQEAVPDRYTEWSGRSRVPRIEPARNGPALWSSQLAHSLRIEFKLLLSERSLWIMVPLVMLLCGVQSNSVAGAFELPVYPVSSEFAQQMVPMLLLLLAGTTIFYAGEVFHRDDSGVRAILYATPVSNSAFLLAKLLALWALASAMVLLTTATAVVSQLVQWWRIDGRTYVDLLPYAHILGRVVLPSTLVLCTVALAVNVLVRNRHAAYLVSILLGAGYVWLLIEGRRDLFLNPLRVGHWGYSDLTGLEPYLERLRLADLYWAGVLLVLMGLACVLLARSGDSWRGYFAAQALRRRPGALLLLLCGLALAGWTGRRLHVRGNELGTRARVEARQLALEDRYLASFGAPRLSFVSADLDVRLRPTERGLDVRGRLVLENPFAAPLTEALFTIDSRNQIRDLRLEGASGPHELDGEILRVPLARPIRRGERRTLELDWSSAPRPGFPADGGAGGGFVLPSAAFVSSFDARVLPIPGVDGRIFLMDEERRRAHGREPLRLLADRSGEGSVPGLFGSERPFDLTARIEAPAHMQVLCSGELVERRDEGEVRVHTFATSAPIHTFAIVAGRFDSAGGQGAAVHHHRDHDFNVAGIVTAMERARSSFERDFGPTPYRSLSIVEFPRVASFAQSFPTLIPFSESIGFLSDPARDPRRFDAVTFVTAHEVAHQWWGYIASPAASAGAQVLSESLAEYSAMLLIDELHGERQRLLFLRSEEDLYLRRRDPDRELPLSGLDAFREGDDAAAYHKGALVFHMLERRMGRERLLQALRSFVTRWRDIGAQPAADDGAPTPSKPGSHPTLPDLLDELRLHARGVELDWFLDQWFHQVVIPDAALTGTPRLRAEGSTWSVEFELTNHGEGRAVVTVEAVAGPWQPTAPPDKNGPGARFSEPLTLTLEPGKTVRGVLSAGFEPEEVVVDRGYGCLDFDRTNNALKLAPLAAPNGAPARPSK